MQGTEVWMRLKNDVRGGTEQKGKKWCQRLFASEILKMEEFWVTWHPVSACALEWMTGSKVLEMRTCGVSGHLIKCILTRAVKLLGMVVGLIGQVPRLWKREGVTKKLMDDSDRRGCRNENQEGHKSEFSFLQEETIAWDGSGSKEPGGPQPYPRGRMT